MIWERVKRRAFFRVLAVMIVLLFYEYKNRGINKGIGKKITKITKIRNPFATFFFVFWRKCVRFWGDINLVNIDSLIIKK